MGLSVDTLDEAIREARLALDRQVAEVRAMDDKAAQIVRFNAILVGLLVTAASFSHGAVVERPIGWLPLVIIGVAGMSGLLLSTMAAVLAYRLSRIALGVSSSTLTGTLHYDITRSEFVANMIRNYASGIWRNERAAQRVARRLDAALVLLPIGLGLIAVSTIGFIMSGVP